MPDYIYDDTPPFEIYNNSPYNISIIDKIHNIITYLFPDEIYCAPIALESYNCHLKVQYDFKTPQTNLPPDYSKYDSLTLQNHTHPSLTTSTIRHHPSRTYTFPIKRLTPIKSITIS